MVVYHSLENLQGLAQKGSVLAMGNFDGIHLGHQKLLESTLKTAEALGVKPAVLTFYPHPAEILRPGTQVFRLMTGEEKLRALEKLGIELVFVVPFDAELAALSPEAFFDRYVLQGMRAKSVHVGFNFRFGQNRKGDTAVLETFCQKAGVKLQVQPKVEVGGQRCSSTAIRIALEEGNLEIAHSMLGRSYSVIGQVVRGDGRGRKLGFPTANLRVPHEKLVPKAGVYAVTATWQKQEYKSVANIGYRPTFHADSTQKTAVLEAHLLHFDANLYDEFLEIKFVARIRDEKRFENIDALKSQILRDIEWAEKNT